MSAQFEAGAQKSLAPSGELRRLADCGSGSGSGGGQKLGQLAASSRRKRREGAMARRRKSSEKLEPKQQPARGSKRFKLLALAALALLALFWAGQLSVARAAAASQTSIIEARGANLTGFEQEDNQLSINGAQSDTQQQRAAAAAAAAAVAAKQMDEPQASGEARTKAPHFATLVGATQAAKAPTWLVSASRSRRHSGSRQASTLRALMGARLALPCANLTQWGALATVAGANAAKAIGKQVALIVWHKDEQLDSPIYTVDARAASELRHAKQAALAPSLQGGRAHLALEEARRGGPLAPVLVIEEARQEDAGLYTCTLEFHKAPTQTHTLAVQLIEPPRNMIIRDQLNGPLQAGLVGPYDEDSRLTLTCEVEQGEPAAQVTWWQLASVGSSHAHLPGQAAQWAGPVNFWPAPEKAKQLTTLTLDSSFHSDALEGQQTARPASGEFFVAFNEFAAGASDSDTTVAATPTLPFNGHFALKRWLRVREQLALGENRVQATIQVPLARKNLADEYLCLANNNDFAPPLNASVKINLNLKPSEVRIVNKQSYAFKLGQKLIVECLVQGSKPDAKITWFRADKEIEPAASTALSPDRLGATQVQNYISEFNSDTGNRSSRHLTRVSYLTLIPQLSDNQQSLVCEGKNPKMPDAKPLIDSIIMNVQFPPQMKLHFGASIKPDSIRLNSDVFMECHIQANPPIEELTWLFNEQPLTANVSTGVIISNQSLALQRIRVEQRGDYQCVAQNSIGRSESNKLKLKPKFEPVCDLQGTKSQYEVGLNQAVKIECSVLAEPDDDVVFTWHFNQTNGVRGAPGAARDPLLGGRLKLVKEFVTNFTRSHVIFTPKTRWDYGNFLCSASNAIESQKEPCVISVIPSESPDPVFGCFFDTPTANSIGVHCQASQSSAGRQTYLLELFAAQEQSVESAKNASLTHLKQRQESPDQAEDQEQDEDWSESSGAQQQQQQKSNLQPQQRQQQVKRLSSETPSFQVDGLRPDTAYNMVIYVQNSRGRSAPVMHQRSTLAALQGAVGQIEFFDRAANKRTSADSVSLSERLISYLKTGDYFGSNTFATKPLLVGVALVLMLCTISIIVLVFFLNRFCGTTRVRAEIGGPDRRSGKKRRKANNSDCDVLSATQLDAGALLSVYGDHQQQQQQQHQQQQRLAPELDRGAQLAAGAAASDSANRLKALAGSGSDSSRETNTESTLLSGGVRQQRAAERPASSSLRALMTPPLKAATPTSGLRLRRAEEAASLYAQTMRRPRLVASPLEPDHSNTPQLSARSSDCASNNELLCHSEPAADFRDQLLIEAGADGEPLYLISRRPADLQGREQIRLLSTPLGGLWTHCTDDNGALSASHAPALGCGPGSLSTGGTQVSSSVATCDSFERTPTQQTNSLSLNKSQAHARLLGNQQQQQQQSGESNCALSIGPLASSVSIPVSLAECVHSLDERGRLECSQVRGVSHEDFLQANLCIDGSYLTLAPHRHLRYAPTYAHFEPQVGACQEHGSLAALSPPASFSSSADPTRYNQPTDGHLAETIEAHQLDHYCT